MANGIIQSSPFSRANGAASPKGTLQGLGFSPLTSNPTGLTPLDAGRLWWRDDLQEYNYYDGVTVKGFGGSLQDAYDLGNTIVTANDLALQLIYTGSTTTGALSDIVAYIVGGTLQEVSIPGSGVFPSILSGDFTVKPVGATTTDIPFTVSSPQTIDFGAAIDLVALNVNVPGVNCTGSSPTLVLIKSTDNSPIDEGLYVLIGTASSGGGTNNEALLVDLVSGVIANLTSTNGTATVLTLANFESGNEFFTTVGNSTIGFSSRVVVANDGSNLNSIQNIFNSPKVGNSSTAISVGLSEYRNLDTSGFSDAPIIYMENLSNAGDLRFTNRLTDPNVLGPGDAGQLWYNTIDDRFKFWNGSAVVPLGGDTLQSAYDFGNSIQATSSRPFQVIDSASDVYGGNTQSYLNIREDCEAVFRKQTFSPYLYRRVMTINSDASVTLIGGTNQVEFGAGIDLIAQGHDINGVNYSNVLGAVLYLKSAPDSADEDMYEITGVANGAGTNSIAIVEKFGTSTSFTAGAAVATTGNTAQAYADYEHQVLAGNTTNGTVLDQILNDGGVLTGGLSIIENLRTGGSNTSVSGFIQALSNLDTSGNSDVPLLVFNNEANAADVQYTPRFGDPIGLSVDGQSWYNDTESRLKLRANGTNESIAYLSDISTGTNPWVNVVSSSQNIAPNTNYVANNVGLVTFTLPPTAAFGDTFVIMGNNAAGWTITQNAGQTIAVGNATTTAGVGGALTSTQVGDTLKLVCVNANTEFRAFAVQGNPNIILLP